jgi:hypothetical protein
MKKFCQGCKEGFEEYGKSLISIVNVVLLSIVYIIGVGLTSILARISKKRFLDLRAKKSYWISLNPKKKPIEAYYRQF